AWQMRASWALADKLIGSSSGVGGGGSGSGAGSAFDDAISLDSIQMVLEGVRGTAATATASSAAANHGPVLTSPNGEPAAQAVYRGSQSALLFEFCSCAALLCLSVGFAVWAAVASWRPAYCSVWPSNSPNSRLAARLSPILFDLCRQRTLAGRLSVGAEAVKCCETVPPGSCATLQTAGGSRISQPISE
uniref:Frizzled domain-containing protein n=1 Tax=Macrostomum lignano TaxID=282301 RepID=A0A1I8FMX4_9PLAT